MRVVVINKDQQRFVEPMAQALLPASPLFVFDRCEPVAGCNYRTNTEGFGFLAGRMRDLGADGYDGDILFLDGDKIPKGDIVGDIEELSEYYDCICYGVDGDKESSEMRSFMKTDGTHGRIPFQAEKFPYAYGCYSCGMWLSRDAVRALRELNRGRIFHPAFDGTWGDEDNFLGDELDHLGFKIGYSTRVRLSGSLSDWKDRAGELTEHFLLRIRLRKELLGAEI